MADDKNITLAETNVALLAVGSAFSRFAVDAAQTAYVFRHIARLLRSVQHKLPMGRTGKRSTRARLRLEMPMRSRMIRRAD